MSRQPRRLQVATNSFKITGLPKKKYYQYDAFSPELKEARRRIDVFERLQNHTDPNLFKQKIIYDSDAIAYSSRVLSFGNSASFNVSMTDRPPPTDGSGNARGVFTVTLLRVDAAPIDFEDLESLVNGHTKQLTPRAAVSLNLLQLIVRQAPNLKYANNVRAFFCKEVGYRSLGGGLEIFKGFFQSIRPTFRSLLVNIDTSCCVVYKEGNMADAAANYLGISNPRDLNLPENSPEIKKLKSFFKDIFISFLHRKGKKKVQSIVPRAGFVEFERTKDETTYTTTIRTYFQENYNIVLKFPEAVGVQIRGGAIIPIELCKVEPNQRYTRKLSPDMTKTMVAFTSEKPKARLDAICRGLVGDGAALDYASSPYVRDAEMHISTAPTFIDGKVLPTPPMQYRGSQPCIPKFGAWNAVNQQFFKPQPIPMWGIVDYSHSRDKEANKVFIEKLGGNCQKLGMSISPPSIYISGSGSNVQADFKQAAAPARQASGQDNAQPTLILVILPPSAPDIRLQVKQWGDVRQGVVTQCVRVDKIARASDQYCNNVAMKINAKLGGVNAVPQSDIMTKLKASPFMIMGADVGHPSPGVKDQPSVASLVWSFDQEAMRYEANTTIQPPRVETILHLEDMVKKAIREFGVPPTRIVFFRDGLSESEYEKVAAKEINDIQNAVDGVWKEKGEKGAKVPKPKLTYIVVGKRHHVRFFPKTEQDADRSGNCPAGFVADQGIGNPIAKDYYLQSHGGLLGTSRPSHYVVIKDDNFSNKPDVLQELSFVLCHSYARATRSVSIPAPVYYADLVCSRANFHFHQDLRYDDSSASVISGQSNFDLNKWEQGFKPRHPNMARKMFFM